MKRGIIFDLDGTLVDSYEAIADSLNHVRQNYGLASLPTDVVRRHVGRGVKNLLIYGLGEDKVEEGLSLYREHHEIACIEKTFLLPKVRSTLEALAQRGCLMSITSNKPSYFTKKIIEALDIASFFSVALGPNDVDHAKPHPEMLLKAVGEMGLTKGEVAYVGDMVVDIETCRRAGITVYVVPTGGSTREELETAEPDVLLEDFSELIKEMN